MIKKRLSYDWMRVHAKDPHWLSAMACAAAFIREQPCTASIDTLLCLAYDYGCVDAKYADTKPDELPDMRRLLQRLAALAACEAKLPPAPREDGTARRMAPCGRGTARCAKHSGACDHAPEHDETPECAAGHSLGMYHTHSDGHICSLQTCQCSHVCRPLEVS